MSDQRTLDPHAEWLHEAYRVSLPDLCRRCRLHAEYVIELVEEGVLDAEGPDPAQWRFDALALRRVQRARRLRRDLGLNTAGVALVLDLLDEVEALRRRRA